MLRSHRAVVIAATATVTLGAGLSVAHAQQASAAPREDLVERDLDFSEVEHQVALRYATSVTTAADTGGAAVVRATIGGEAAYQAAFGREQHEYLIDADVAASASRLEGTVRASGVATRARLAIGPAPLPASNRDAANMVPFPFSFELEHTGDLAALPSLADRADVLRAPYLRQRVALATRALRVEYSEDGIDQEHGGEPTLDREVGALDLFAVRGDVEVTGQGGTRVDAGVTVGLFGVVVRFPAELTGDIVALEARATELPDGQHATTSTFWIVRADTTNDATGARYTLAWGIVVGQDTPVGRARRIDHRTDTHVGGIGFFGDPRRGHGLGAQYLRAPYVTMAGEPAIEDRLFVEAWQDVRTTRLVGRVFVAHTGRRLASGEDASDWTGGVELDARRDVGPFAVGAHAEGGHSFYAALDGGAPTAALGARAALTIQRASGRRWFY